MPVIGIMTPVIRADPRQPGQKTQRPDPNQTHRPQIPEIRCLFHVSSQPSVKHNGSREAGGDWGS